MNRKFFLLIFCFLIVLVISFVVVHECKRLSHDKIDELRLMSFWACMDGCSNMQELVFTFDGDNESMRSLHENCSARCYSQHNVVVDS